jgi:hypothetical protein
MAINYCKALFIFVFIFGGLAAKAQIKTNETKKPGLELSLNYLSNSVYMGRADSVRTATISSQIKYSFNSGIFLSGSLDIIPNRKKNKLDGGDITVGYDFDLNEDLSGGIAYSKLFYSKTSTQVASAVSSTINANLTYDISDIISPTLSADYNINKQGINGDLFLNLAIAHDFTVENIFADDDNLTLSPTAELNTGTQNFFNGYVTNRKLKNAKKAAIETAIIQAYTAQLSQYRLLDYEFSLPVAYHTDNFTVNLKPVYTIARDQFKSAAVVNALGLSGQTSIFFLEIGLSLKF